MIPRPLSLSLLLAASAASALPPFCGCAPGFPPLPVSGFRRITGTASCVVNYVQFVGASGKAVFSSGTRASGGQPFSITCPGNATISGFSYLCNTNGGPSGKYPSGEFASLSSLGGATCSDGSAALVTGTLNGNVCVLGGGYTQIGSVDCGADGSAPAACAAAGGGGECSPGAATHAPCAGTSTCSVVPSPPAAGGPWPMMYHDASHTNTGGATGPTTPTIKWTYGLSLAYGIVVASDVRALKDDVIIATTDWQDRSAPPPSGGINAITFDGKPAFQWINPDGGFMDCAPSIGADGTIFLGETNEHALAQNASLLWTATLDPDGPYASSSVLGPDGTIYFATSSFAAPPVAFAYAISPGGAVRWVIPTGPLPANVHAPPAVSLDGNTVYFNWASTLHALATADGSKVWAVAVAGECTPSVGADASVYCGSAAFTAAGVPRWAVPSGSNASTFLAPSTDGRLYGLSADGGSVLCISAETGSVVWTVPAPAGSAVTAFLLGGGSGSGRALYVRVGTSVVALARASGTQMWSIDLPGADNTQAVAGFAMMSDGTLLFATAPPDATTSSTIYAIGDSGALRE